MAPVMERNGGERCRLHEIQATAYLGPVRDFLRENSTSVLRVNPSEDARAQMEIEAERCMTFLEGQTVELPGKSISAEERGMIDESFTELMVRLVKISSNAARLETDGIVPFGELDEEDQQTVRGQFFAEYVELCGMLSGSRGRVSKMACESSAALYYDPGTVRQIIFENEDLDRTNVVRVIAEKPVSAERAMERAREEFERAAEKFPTIPHSVLKTHIVKAPDTYETGVKKYAEQHGLTLDPGKGEVPSADRFLETLRVLLRSPDYHMNSLRPPAEFREVARKIGQEAVFLMDEGEPPTEDANLREGFRKKAELLTLAANRAWRRGDMPVSPDQAPATFQRALFSRVLEDFLEIHDILSGQTPHTYGKSIDANPVLYYGPEEIRSMVSANPDLRTGHIRTIIARHPDRPEEALAEFRERIEQVMAAQPRLMRSEAMVIAVQKSGFETAAAENKKSGSRLAPSEFIKAVRVQIKDDLYIATASGDVKREIEEHRAEISELFEALDWTFAGTKLPKRGQAALVKKVEEFITACERVYRAKGTTPRFRDYSAEERKALYTEFAENFTQLAEVFHPRTAADWKTNPALYMDAEELTALRSDYSELTDWAFRRVLGRGYKDAAGAFKRFDEVRGELARLYPGLSPTFIRRMALERPESADATIMDHIRKNSETLYRRTASSKTEPNPERPEGIHSHIQTMIRQEQMLLDQAFDERTEAAISTFRNRTVATVAELEGSENLDGPNMKKFLNHIEHYVRASEALHLASDTYPNILGLPAEVQDSFIETVYKNQLELNRLIANGHGSPAFRIYSFGFFHNSSYMESLWKHYEGYLPRNLITLCAITSFRKPFEKVNECIEYQAELLKAYPELSAQEINEALWRKARD